MTVVVRRFPRQHYKTVFNPSTGFFVRVEDPGYQEPFWAAEGPELIDVAITNHCERACARCYRKSGPRGRHMSVSDYREVLKQASELLVMQAALGGGNPNEHPEFSEILRMTREDFGIVPNYTTNGSRLSDGIIEATAVHCGAVAVSAYEPYGEARSAITRLKSAGIKTNLHFVLDAESIDIAMEWVSDPPNWLNQLNAVIFLNFKPVGRLGGSRLLRNSDKVQAFMDRATTENLPFKVGFDSCMVSGLAAFTDVDPRFYEPCDAGRFSMFVSQNMLAFPCSFMEESWEGVSLRSNSLREVWRSHPSFAAIRGALKKSECKGCHKTTVCKSGCPAFPQINICGTDPGYTDEHRGRGALQRMATGAGVGRKPPFPG